MDCRCPSRGERGSPCSSPVAGRAVGVYGVFPQWHGEARSRIPHEVSPTCPEVILKQRMSWMFSNVPCGQEHTVTRGSQDPVHRTQRALTSCP